MKTDFSLLFRSEAQRVTYDRLRDPVCLHLLGSRKRLTCYNLERHFKIICPVTGELREVMIRLLRPIKAGDVLRPEDIQVVLFCRFLKYYVGNQDKPDDHIEFDHESMKVFLIDQYRRAGYLDNKGRLYSRENIIKREEALQRERRVKEHAREKAKDFFHWRKQQALLVGKDIES